MHRKGIAALVMAGALLFTSIPIFAGGRAEASDEIVLTWPGIWVGQDSKAAVMEEIVAEFNEKHAGSIRVVVEPQPDYDGYEDSIRTRLAAGQAPDIFTFKLSPTTAAYYDSNLLMDFSRELAQGWGDNFNQGNLRASTVAGATKSLPYEIGFTPIWYNQELFQEAGIESFPETMDQFWRATEKLKAIGAVPTSQMTGGTNAWTSMLWYTHFVGSFGGPGVWERGLDDPAFEKAAAVLKRLYQDGNTTRDAIGADAGVSGGHYQAGRTAMFINGPWYIGNIRENSPEVYRATRLAAAPKAGNYHGHQVGWLHTNLAAANTTDPARREAVITFLQHLTSPENARRVSLASGSLLAIEFDIPDDVELDPLQRMFIEAGNEAAFLIDHLEASMPVDVVYEFGQALGAMVLRDLSPVEFVEMLRASL
ncbi:raffinose/stachyose/melibiose transport system substrate-binding protein [Alkalispirochaeta americana]|uniref:Raffinose/stachyose/melibiose transport system substrate-binding protein n=1 Tax=Alkalispirochaeta americana TaxID=159291 RepID=A0A1N6VDX2_9SPIO|nr:ABC transporter substrate-binding protein [Alkalispirochaeta americana]SIQ75949.1 raffinose/stachyose/melibiose transport system substrate-binding protein [Alkalispirochaeta americana]